MRSEPAREHPGLDLAPMRAARFRADGDLLSALLSPPYDVVDETQRSALLDRDDRNIIGLVLPAVSASGVPDYAAAAERLRAAVAEGLIGVDPDPALYVYEMADDRGATRGLVGAVRLQAAADRVIFPHEDTMAGPVADRLALMEATQANLEPIYLVYDGGGAATDAVARMEQERPIAQATTPDGVRHRLWAITHPDTLASIEADLAGRSAVIADGHHRYATYLEMQARQRRSHGPGPWDRGLALLVDSTAFGPRVEAIHRVVPGLDLDGAARLAAGAFAVRPIQTADPVDAPALLKTMNQALDQAIDDAHDSAPPDFGVVVTDGARAVLITDPSPEAVSRAFGGEPHNALLDLDVTIVHRLLVGQAWGRPDTVDALRYAHTAQEAIAAARASDGVAILLRPTPVESVLAVARAGLRMPRKSTLFLPKPASGVLLRRFADQHGV